MAWQAEVAIWIIGSVFCLVVLVDLIWSAFRSTNEEAEEDVEEKFHFTEYGQYDSRTWL